MKRFEFKKAFEEVENDIIFAATSNPSKSDYISWIKEEVAKEEGAFLRLISGPIVDAITIK